jgi:hypothetical protein
VARTWVALGAGGTERSGSWQMFSQDVFGDEYSFPRIQ